MATSSATPVTGPGSERVPDYTVINQRIFFFIFCVALCVFALAALLLLVGDPARAHISTRFVATTGIDICDCTDPNNPCRTVQYAVDRVTSGDVVFIRTGRWARRDATKPWSASEKSAGLHASCARWLKARDVASTPVRYPAAAPVDSSDRCIHVYPVCRPITCTPRGR